MDVYEKQWLCPSLYRIYLWELCRRHTHSAAHCEIQGATPEIVRRIPDMENQYVLLWSAVGVDFA
jgi:hypothetical protein